jgi:hypothetical protein
MQSRRQPRKEKRQSRVFLKSKKGYLLEGWICSTIEAVRTVERERERGVVDFLLLYCCWCNTKSVESSGKWRIEKRRAGTKRLQKIGVCWLICKRFQRNRQSLYALLNEPSRADGIYKCMPSFIHIVSKLLRMLWCEMLRLFDCSWEMSEIGQTPRVQPGKYLIYRVLYI